MKLAKILSVLSALSLLPAVVQAQWSVAPHIIISVPTADFANISDVGGGLGIKGVYGFRSLGGLGLGADFGYITYGGTTFENVNNFPARVRNESFRLTVGPHISLGAGSFKLRLFAMGGFYVFRESRTITDGFFVVQDTGESQEELGWNFGGALQYDIGLGPWLDASVEYNTIKNIPGPPPQNPDDTRPEIDANEITVKLGVIFFLGS